VVFDWGEIGPLFVFCAVAAWSRVRFVYFADNLGAEATMTGLARCFEYLGAVPKTALTDRMGCLKGASVAGLVVPTPAYVRFATHYGFRPDFCEGADPSLMMWPVRLRLRIRRWRLVCGTLGHPMNQRVVVYGQDDNGESRFEGTLMMCRCQRRKTPLEPPAAVGRPTAP
jgi:transposase